MQNDELTEVTENEAIESKIDKGLTRALIKLTENKTNDNTLTKKYIDLELKDYPETLDYIKMFLLIFIPLLCLSILAVVLFAVFNNYLGIMISSIITGGFVGGGICFAIDCIYAKLKWSNACKKLDLIFEAVEKTAKDYCPYTPINIIKLKSQKDYTHPIYGIEYNESFNADSNAVLEKLIKELPSDDIKYEELHKTVLDKMQASLSGGDNKNYLLLYASLEILHSKSIDNNLYKENFNYYIKRIRHSN